MSECFRTELKFVISHAQAAMIESRISAVMHRDTHLGGKYGYLIRSIYFDDVNDTCFFDTVNGNVPRSKFRIRAYDCDSSYICCEEKRKDGFLSSKTSTQITLDEYYALLNLAADPCALGGSAAKLATLEKTAFYQPKTIVEYFRTPYVYETGNVRITFDSEICSSCCYEGFFDKGLAKRPVLPGNMLIMEVKYDELIPDYIFGCLQTEELDRTSFSKYSLCRTLHI